MRDGGVVETAGDPAFVTSLRSAAKPLQALPLARVRPDLTDDELAIAAASHLGEPPHVEAVRSLLAQAEVSESQLECGIQEDRPPDPIYHNCSGKHAGMLAVCRARGWPTDGYRLPGHPLQHALLEELANAAETDPADVATGTDGCGVVAFALPLERVARAFSRLERLDGGARVAQAMRARPELIRGAGATDTLLMQALPGWIAKSGAEGLICAAGPGGLGVAVKVEDGSGRALRPALAAFLSPLGGPIDGFARTPVLNSHGEEVGCAELGRPALR